MSPTMPSKRADPPAVKTAATGGGDRYVALLRGINVGRAKRIAMADLRALIASLGYRDVQTLLNSGNVVFTAPAAAAAPAAGKTGAARTAGAATAAATAVAATAAASIEAALVAKLGVAARITVLPAAELAAIVRDNTLLAVAADPARLLVTVLNDPADRARLLPLLAEAWEPEALALGDRVAYMWCAAGILDSRLGKAIGRLLRDGVTARNWTTILKLHALAQGSPADG
jgi:uncharacterized protein (DUF1697 family)